MKTFLFLVIVIVMGMGFSARAEDDVAKLPRFVSLAKDDVFVRTGPALQYPIKWVYKKRGLPVEITREYDTWRKIKDIDGDEGWVHHAMLSGYRNAIINSKDGVTLTAKPDALAQPVVRLEKGVVVSIDKCQGAWCRLGISGFRGFAPRDSLWGIYPAEEIR